MIQRMFSDEIRSNPLMKKWKELKSLKEWRRGMWENLKKDKSWCRRRGGASSMANLSFVPAQLLRIFFLVERGRTVKKFLKWCEGSQRQIGVNLDQVLPYIFWDKIWSALLFTPRPLSVCLLEAQRMDCAQAAQHHVLQVSQHPMGRWLCSQPIAAVFPHLLQPSSGALLHHWQYSSGSAD